MSDDNQNYHEEPPFVECPVCFGKVGLFDAEVDDWPCECPDRSADPEK